MTSEQRFYAKVEPMLDDLGCWEWTGCKNPKGYGLFKSQFGNVAHRFAWCLLFGAVPAGLELDHLCRNRGCVNPSHLEAVTHRENLSRGAIGHYDRPSACKNGHPFSATNTHSLYGKYRQCRECGRIRTQRYRERISAR